MEQRKPRILVVEDEAAIRTGLADVLVFHGFDVDAVADGKEGLAKALSGRYDLLLLDVMLPGRDGFAICDEVRKVDRAQPIILLTAKTSDEDIVNGLTLGADDYVAKPFAFDELVARIRAVLRRRGAAALDRLGYADVVLDLGSREVSRDAVPVDLTGTEFELLVHLVRRARQVQSRAALLHAVWGFDTPVDSNVVDVHIGHLRRKLGEPELIRTVRGVGYVLRAAP